MAGSITGRPVVGGIDKKVKSKESNGIPPELLSGSNQAIWWKNQQDRTERPPGTIKKTEMTILAIFGLLSRIPTFS